MLPYNSVFKRALDGGIAALVADAAGKTLWDSHMGDGWTQAQKDRWHARFKDTHPPSVYKGYPRSHFKFPSWAIVNLGKTDGVRAISDRVRRNTATRMDVLGGLKTWSVGIHIYAESIDEADVHEIMVTRMILGYKKWMIDNHNVDNVVFSHSSDVEPNPALLPEEIFVRVMEWVVTGLEASYTSLGSPPAPLPKIYTYVDVDDNGGGVTVDGVDGRVIPS